MLGGIGGRRRRGRQRMRWLDGITDLMDLSLSKLPGSSAGKEFTCNARDPSLIPELGSFTGEGIGCPLQYSWASLVA